MKKKMIGLLLCAAMLIGLLPTVALATTETQTADFTAADNGVAALALLNAAKTGTEDSTWDKDSKVLTLKGVDFTTTATRAVELPAGSTIVLEDGTTNTITGGNAMGVGTFCSYGIYADGNLTIQGEIAGTGTLTATGGKPAGQNTHSCGIYAETGNVTIKSGTVTATGVEATNSNGSSFGIYVAAGNVTIESATVTATGGTADDESYGIYASDSVTISGTANVTATGGEAARESSGIYSYDSVAISGTADVEATGGTSDWTSYGIYADDVAISGTADVDTTGGAATNTEYYAYSCGIYAYSNMAISDSADVTATGGTASTMSLGIEADDVTISGSANVTAEGSTADVGSVGIYADAVTIQGGTVTATGDEAGYGSTGIYANDAVTIQDGTVTATAKSGPAIAESYGIWAGYYDYDDQLHAGTVTIESGTVILDTGAAGNTALGGGTLALASGIARTGEAEPLVQKYADTPVVFSDVTPTTVTVTGITANDKTYDGTKAAEVDIASASLTGVSAGDTVSLGMADVTAAFENADAGTGKTVTVSGLDLCGKDAYKYSLTQPTLTATITPCTTVTDATETAQTIYVGEGSSFRAPDFTGVGDEAATGAVAYTVGGESKTIDDIIAHLNTLTAGDSVDVAYTFAGEGNYLGASATGTITVTIASRPVYIVPTYSVTAAQPENGAVTVSTKNAYAGTTVTVTVTPDEGYILAVLTVTDQKGAEIALTDKGDGTYTFTMPGRGVTVEAVFMEENTMPDFFTDVPDDAYYYDAVVWAVENKITEGTGDGTTFSPDDPCTRAQIVTFLWRAAGCPEPATADCPFTDVDLDSYYGKAVLWAAEKGITKGTTDSTFSPDDVCTRAQTVTFLHRAAGMPDAGTANSFTDVKADTYYAGAVDWAVEQEITDGTGNNAFSPDDDCTRAQIVTFLWRWMVK